MVTAGGGRCVAMLTINSFSVSHFISSDMAAIKSVSKVKKLLIRPSKLFHLVVLLFIVVTTTTMASPTFSSFLVNNADDG